ncbi:formylglycine-generating enzyme family protein [Lacibacterium aquatile]|uniref:Formylglycine-generating enzyme family protein n=1 Tax=Lacibacterium aquatile TaxID=1168082 RepID=A0ABW5DW08_9PROT
MSRLLLAALLLCPGLAAAADAPWPERIYNPQKAEGDLLLPMPCGGAMAFRRVELPADGLLGDRRVQLGRTDEALGYAENSRADYVGGGFTDPKKKGTQAYYIGKYEVTQAQWAAFDAPCRKVTDEGRMPAINVTWAESVGFAAKYSAWAVANATKELPQEDGSPAFLRLPTEAEWEYAARGGAAVPESTFIEATFPMSEAPARYVWYQGTDSANNELNAVGLLKPNPLGLHDVLGNVGEFVLDPFRLNKLSRLHGQAGGQIVKGGDYRTPLKDLRSAARQEFAPVDKKGERRSAMTGLRLVLVAPSLPSPQRLTAIRAEWAALPTSASVAPQDDPVKEAEALAQSVDDPALRQRIAALSTVIKTSIQTRNEQRDRAAVNALRVGAYVADKLVADSKLLEARRSILKTAAAGSPERKGYEEGLARSQAAFDDNLSYYLDVALAVASDYPPTVVSSQAEVLKRDLEAKKVTALNKRIDTFVKHVERLRGGQNLDRAKLLDEID